MRSVAKSWVRSTERRFFLAAQKSVMKLLYLFQTLSEINSFLLDCLE